jgi:chemotaxis protein CheZ
MSELRALRELIELRADQGMLQRCRSQLADGQAYKRELDLIHQAIRRTKAYGGSADNEPLGTARPSQASRELQAIVVDTEQATQSILQAAEAIDQSALMLATALKGRHEQGLANDIQDRIVKIFEACNFQDLTSQRAAKVAATLNFIEERVACLRDIWRAIEASPIAFDDARDGERTLLNGPKLSDEPGHASQDEIDAIFGCA